MSWLSNPAVTQQRTRDAPATGTPGVRDPGRRRHCGNEGSSAPFGERTELVERPCEIPRVDLEGWPAGVGDGRRKGGRTRRTARGRRRGLRQRRLRYGYALASARACEEALGGLPENVGEELLQLRAGRRAVPACVRRGLWRGLEANVKLWHRCPSTTIPRTGRSFVATLPARGERFGAPPLHVFGCHPVMRVPPRPGSWACSAPPLPALFYPRICDLSPSSTFYCEHSLCASSRCRTR